ncbi:hypothetical protein A1O7_01652 [Cladophialophora yegresii CBS 114405]|uniref:Uncharacterized protein n=1 Tax=Cladophialophora yegresii CBS 114405 TaxID=1182544 RepID=W9WL10_9EURO|nr:uncharacterized protein A1O7_01652 [Cladophialophora yegresii CBS 114405]EXJ65311.1 hypothetical protein A1O7_01652 [Cladophialophora yegresii CBS 114405]
MNPYNQPPYGYPQQTPGPPQPPWQAPPRRQGWGDPRVSGQGLQSPISPAYPNIPPSNAFGPPLPPPPPPPLPQSQYPPPAQFDTSQWGVKYNQGLAATGQGQDQDQETKPALPPRPTSATGRLSPQPHQHNHSQSYSGWNDPYHTSNAAPPPPPPRPAEYQAHIQAAHYGRTSTPHQEYSHQPASHHYDPAPPQQNSWNTQPSQTTGPTYYPTAPPPQHLSGTVDGPLVSPIEPTGNFWGAPHGQQTTAQAQNIYNAPPHQLHNQPANTQVLGFGGPSDWEHYDPNAPPSDQTPTSPPPNLLYQTQGPISPPQTHATPAPIQQTPKPDPARPSYPVEIGAPSPVTPRNGSQVPPTAANYGRTSPQSAGDGRPSSAGRQPSDISARSDSLDSAGNIDSVIQAWNTPLKPRPVPDSTPRTESRASAPTVEPGLSSTSVKVVDPYADLEPEFKASLKRYAVMLRREAAAKTDEEKFDIFQGFVTKELRLRSLLYGVELKKKVAKEVKKAASLADIQAVLPKSALPPATAKPDDVGQLNDPITKTVDPVPAPALAEPAPTQPSVGVLGALAQPAVIPKGPPTIGTSKLASTVPSRAQQAAGAPPLEDRPKSKDDGYVIVAAPGQEEAYSPGGRPLVTKVKGGDDDEAYSPGGRPLTTRAATTSSARPAVGTMIQEHFRQTPPNALSPSNDAPMVIEDYITPEPTSPSINAPMIVAVEPPIAQASPRLNQRSQKPIAPIKFEPSRPVYTPFRYNAGVQEEKTKDSPLRPADQAYSSLRHSQAGTGRLLAQDAALLAPVRPSSSSGRKEHEEAFIGLIRKQSMAVRQNTPGPAPAPPLPRSITPGAVNNKATAAAKPEPPPFMRVGTPAAPAPTSQQPADVVKGAVTALRSLLPSLDDLPTPIDSSGTNPKLRIVRSKIDSVKDQFSFIHEAVVEWDRTNRLVRKEQEAERQQRQGESEAHIDALFNDNEIGYAGIGELEAEFKLSEAEKRYHEDQAELESFTSQVFVVVTERLQKEIAELMTAYTMAIDVLDRESVAVSGCFKAQNSGDKKPIRMTEIMSCVLTLFNKIEIRHQKLAEAHVERERRRKHLELTILYTNGDVQGVKRLEKEFAVAEKMAVLHEARAKDDRANKLMDTFDRATVRGLGDNQVFTDEVLCRLAELKKAVDALPGSSSDERDVATGATAAVRETLSLAHSTLDSVVTDSRRLLALSNEGDILLNEADYNLSVAEARVANADASVYAKLQDEKQKEDSKLVEEMNARTASVTKGPEEAIRLVRDIQATVTGGGGEAGGGEGGHEERIKRALEAAKARNASISGSGMGDGAGVGAAAGAGVGGI